MKRREIQRQRLYFIEDDIEAIEKDILIISQEKLDHLLNKISTYAQHDLIEIDILNAFLTVIQERTEYYYQKQDQSYDYATIKSAIILLILLGLLLYGFYLWQGDNLSKHQQLKILIEELKPYGITVKEHSKRYYKHTKYWLEVILTKDLDHYQWIKAKKIIGQIYNLHSDIYGTNKWIFIIMFCGTMYIIKELFLKIRQCLKPRYKERYAKYTILENMIKQKITQLSAKYKVK